MNLKSEQLLILIECFQQCQFLLGIHLSDNDITKVKYSDITNDYDYEETFYSAIRGFGITDEDLLAINRSKRANFKLTAAQEKNLIKSFFEIDYQETLKKYFTQTKPKTKIENGENPISQRKKFKDHILLGKDAKMIDKFRMINRIQVYYGAGRNQDNATDQFVVTRKLNHSELIFNQRIQNDYTKFRFFKKDAG